MVASGGTRTSISAAQLKTRLGWYLRAVQRGITITITVRGVPVASLSRVRAREEGIDAALDVLEGQGILSRGTGEALSPCRAIRLSGEPIDRAIARDRGDRL